MGCNESKEKDNPHTVLACTRDEKGRLTVPPGKQKLELVDQNLRELPEYVLTDGVTKLDLSMNKLTTLPKHMGTVWGSLAELVLSGNDFHRIPVGVATLPSLTTLHLNRNPLDSSDAFKILPSCPALTSLHLGDCALRDVPAVLQECRIEQLCLMRNPGIALKTLPNLLHLKTLVLSQCSLMDLPPELVACIGLQTLDLSGNFVEDPELHKLRELPILEELTMRNMGWRCIPSSIASLKALRKLNLSGNTISSAHGIEGTSLTTLDLSNNGLTAPPAGLGLARGLLELNLSNNKLTTLDGLATSTMASTLTSLDISGNPPANPVRGDNEMWGEIARLRSLQHVIYRQSRVHNPYSTRIPLSLFTLPLRTINYVELQPHFGNNPGENLVEVLKHGYFKVDFGLDWDSRVTYHVRLLRCFHEARRTLEDHLPVSILRYKMFLALQHLMAEDKLIAPLDVAFVHYIHMTYPELYEKDCTELFKGVIGNYYHGVDRSNSKIHEHRRYLNSVSYWNNRYGGKGWKAFDYPLCEEDPDAVEVLDLIDSVPEVAKDLLETPLSVDFLAVSDGIFEHIAKVVEFSAFLIEHSGVAVGRYLKFLALQATRYQVADDDEDLPPLAATPGIQLVQHVHQCMPQNFGGVMRLLLGRLVDLNLRVLTADDPTFTEAIERTERQWKEAYGEEYLSENLFRDSTPHLFSPTAKSHLRKLQQLVSHESTACGCPPRPRRPSLRGPDSKAASHNGVTLILSAGV